MTASLPVFLIADGRLLRGHETRLRYELQYSVLSACPTPLWPAVDPRGLPDGRPVFTQAGLLPSALLLAGSATAGANFIPLFYLGIFLEELLLLVGCWLLSRRLFPSPYAAFFVSIAAVGSAFGLDHFWLNVHTIAALPLLLFLLHGFLDDGSRKKFFLACVLAVAQAAGSPPGAGLAAPIAAALYFCGRAFVLREPLGRRLKDIGWRKRDSLLVLAVLAAELPVVMAGAWGGPGEAAPLRLHDLLVIAGLSNPLKYFDVLPGATPSLDWSFYCGALTLAFAIAAILTESRTTLLRLAIALPAALLILGAVLLPFRIDPAPALGVPLVRLFVVFLAGAGFQRLLSEPKSAVFLGAGRFLVAGSLILALASWAAAMRPELLREFLQALVAGEPASSTGSPALQPWLFPERSGMSIAADLLGAAALTAGLAGALLLLRGSGSRLAPLALTLLLVLHPLDVFSWKFRMSWLKTFAANPVQRDLQRLAPLPDPPPRVASLSAAPRYKAFHRTAPGRANPQYLPRKEPAEIVPAYWGIELRRNAFERPSPPAWTLLLLGVNSLFWILWTLRAAGLLAFRGRTEP